jgi:glycerophosphoryl diester phosphodiesterase
MLKAENYALVVKGLSRLPVTEEIAGSNPVERATKQRHRLMAFFRGYSYTKIMQIFGHRGACGLEPENTLVSFKRALELDVDMIELDVYALPSGEVVVIHDDKVDRTTDGTGYVMDIPFDELRDLDAGKGEKIPLLTEVLDLVDKRVPVNIELKGLGTAVKVAEIIKLYKQNHDWTDEHFFVSSFNHVELQHFHHLVPTVKIGALVGHIPVDYAAFAENLGAFSANLNAEFITKEFVDDAHRRNLKVFVYTVNDEEEFQRMQHLDVDGIFTNYPDQARTYFANRYV